MLLTTTPNIQGREITQYFGIVSGETIIGANLFKDFFKTLFHFKYLISFFILCIYYTTDYLACQYFFLFFWLLRVVLWLLPTASPTSLEGRATSLLL